MDRHCAYSLDIGIDCIDLLVAAVRGSASFFSRQFSIPVRFGGWKSNLTTTSDFHSSSGGKPLLCEISVLISHGAIWAAFKVEYVHQIAVDRKRWRFGNVIPTDDR
ncbi:MAG: hypothetical protein CBD74_01240 [Saprospirales bacterium TMED214]|nr:MAG: hypothetical protein CBD74_01240 [Saprospirales bacterium TMED214]